MGTYSTPVHLTEGTDNIGDIDIAVPDVPTAISGTVAVVGPTAIVAAPAAGTRIVVIAFVLQGESATAMTIQIHLGATATAGFRVLAQNQGDGISITFAPGREWRGGSAEALNITLSGTNSCGYSVLYFTETV